MKIFLLITDENTFYFREYHPSTHIHTKADAIFLSVIISLTRTLALY